MTKPSIEQLQERIESVIREYVAACRAAAATAVERGFGAPRRRGPGSGGAAKPTRHSPSRRRGAEEVARLSERLYEAICGNPGALMGALSAQLGASPRDLNRPAVLLRRAGRVRSVGQRQLTRYFPIASKPA